MFPRGNVKSSFQYSEQSVYTVSMIGNNHTLNTYTKYCYVDMLVVWGLLRLPQFMWSDSEYETELVHMYINRLVNSEPLVIPFSLLERESFLQIINIVIYCVNIFSSVMPFPFTTPDTYFNSLKHSILFIPSMRTSWAFIPKELCCKLCSSK